MFGRCRWWGRSGIRQCDEEERRGAMRWGRSDRFSLWRRRKNRQTNNKEKRNKQRGRKGKRSGKQARKETTHGRGWLNPCKHHSGLERRCCLASKSRILHSSCFIAINYALRCIPFNTAGFPFSFSFSSFVPCVILFRVASSESRLVSVHARVGGQRHQTGSSMELTEPPNPAHTIHSQHAPPTHYHHV